MLRRLGSTDLVTSLIGLNAVSFTAGCGPVDRVEAAAIVTHVLEIAGTLVDATDLTGSGDVEVLVGRAVRGRRDNVVLASRAGARYTPQGRLTAVDARPARLARACDTTLRRLGTDRVDLYFLDRVDPRVPIEESMAALARLVEAGKVRHVGVSHVDAEQLRRAHAVHPVAAVGAEYSLLERDIERNVLPTARALGVGLAAYRPLGRGLLTGSLTSLDQLAGDDYRHADARFQPESFASNRAVVTAAERLATRRHLSVGRLALAWLLAQGSNIVPLPGTRSLTHLEMNLAAAQVRLTPDDRSQLAVLLNTPAVASPDGGSSAAGGHPEPLA
jgi:aryl-alcohol dehydrogenase-like predicted oxidoreductase